MRERKTKQLIHAELRRGDTLKLLKLYRESEPKPRTKQLRLEQEEVYDRALKVLESDKGIKELIRRLDVAGLKRVTLKELEEAKNAFSIHRSPLGYVILAQGDQETIKQLVIRHKFRRHEALYKAIRDYRISKNSLLVTIDGENIYKDQHLPTTYSIGYKQDNKIIIHSYTLLNIDKNLRILESDIPNIKKLKPILKGGGVSIDSIVLEALKLGTPEELLRATSSKIEDLLREQDIVLSAHNAVHDLVVIPSMVKRGRDLFSIKDFKFRKHSAGFYTPIEAPVLVLDLVNLSTPLWNHSLEETARFALGLEFKKSLDGEELQIAQVEGLKDKQQAKKVVVYNALDVLITWLMTNALLKPSIALANASHSKTSLMIGSSSLSKKAWENIAIKRYRALPSFNSNINKQLDKFFSSKKDFLIRSLKLSSNECFQLYSGNARVLYPTLSYVFKYMRDTNELLFSKFYKEIKILERGHPILSIPFHRYYESLNALPFTMLSNLKESLNIGFVYETTQAIEEPKNHYWYSTPSFETLNNRLENFKDSLEQLGVLIKHIKAMINIGDYFMYLKHEIGSEQFCEECSKRGHKDLEDLIRNLQKEGLIVDLGIANVVSISPGSILSSIGVRRFKEGFEVKKQLPSKFDLEQKVIPLIVESFFDKGRDYVLEELKNLITLLKTLTYNNRLLRARFGVKQRDYSGHSSWIRIAIKYSLPPGDYELVFNANGWKLYDKISKNHKKPTSSDINAMFKKLFGFDLKGKGDLKKGSIGKVLAALYYEQEPMFYDLKRDIIREYHKEVL